MNDPGPKADVIVGASFRFVGLPEDWCYLGQPKQEFGGTRERAVHSTMLSRVYD
jgi:hypothetical protein